MMFHIHRRLFHEVYHLCPHEELHRKKFRIPCFFHFLIYKNSKKQIRQNTPLLSKFIQFLKDFFFQLLHKVCIFYPAQRRDIHPGLIPMIQSLSTFQIILAHGLKALAFFKKPFCIVLVFRKPF